MTIELRWAGPRELDDLQSLYLESSRHWESDRDFLAGRPDLVEPSGEQIVGGRVRVIADGGCVAGFSTVVPGDGSLELEALFVAPAAMGRGLGRRLVADASDLARSAGLTRVEVTANPNAVGFYQRVGFVVTGAATTELGPALRMALAPRPLIGSPRGRSGGAGSGGAADLEVVEESIARLAEHGEVSIGYLVETVLDAGTLQRDPRDLDAAERRVAEPWVKDYDALGGEGPTRWARHFDVSRWGLLAARRGEERVGGAVVAFDTPGVDMLEGRADLAVLWDLRVHPEARSRGVGSALVDAVESWVRARGCRRMTVETQNVNVPACRFYAGRGFRLVAIEPGAYPELPDEARLIWTKQLRAVT